MIYVFPSAHCPRLQPFEQIGIALIRAMRSFAPGPLVRECGEASHCHVRLASPVRRCVEGGMGGIAAADWKEGPATNAGKLGLVGEAVTKPWEVR